MAESGQSVLSQQLESLSQGVRAARDPFTYKAAAAAFVPVVAVWVLVALSLNSGFVSVAADPTRALESFLLGGVGWLIAITVVSFLAFMWAAIALGIRSTTDYQGSSAGLLSAAALRVPAAIGAWLLLALAAAGLYGITWLLTQMAGVPVLSIVVVVLSIPLVVFWVVLALTAMAATAFVPAFAAADSRLGPMQLLSRTAGLMLAYTAPTVLLLALAAGVAALTAFLFYTAAGLAIGMSLAPLATEMIINGRGVSAALVGIISLLLIAASFWGPWGVYVGSVTDYARRMANDPEVLTTPVRVFSFGLARARRAASTATAAADAARARLAVAAESAAQARQAATPQPVVPDRSVPVSAAPVVAAAPEAASETTRSCTACGAANPSDFRFCKMCGTRADP